MKIPTEGSLSLRRHTHCVIVIGPQHPTISMQLLCKCLNNNAVNTLWNTPYYICTNIIKSIKIVCVCGGGGGGTKIYIATYEHNIL